MTGERIRAAVRRLVELGPVSEVVAHGASEAADAAGLDRVLLSRIADGVLVVERLHGGDAPAEAAAVRLVYPLLECELVRRRRALLVTDADPDRPTRYAFAASMRWREYVAAPVIVEGRVIGFLHGDRAGGRPLEPADSDALEWFAEGFGLVFERAVLRRRLRDQRREIERIATWAEVRSSELSNGAIELSVDRAEQHDRHASPGEVIGDVGLVADLTARELDVLRLMADGKTNGAIARALVVTEGTVKFHVKNVLRKMQATNRADAASRYLRLTLRESPTHR
jgi:LuxR family transcriptional regulator, regulator of acetate metabolism